MSRFQQAIYCKVLKEPRRRYLLKKKEKLLWKHGFSKKEVFFSLAFLIVWIGGLFVIIATLRWVWLILGYMLLVPILFAGFAEERKQKFRKSKPPISLNEFIARAKNFKDVSNVYIRAVRHVLGDRYQINSCQTYPEDIPNALFHVSERMSKPPFAFEIIVGVANQLSISLSEQNIDQITDNICDCANIEELIVKLSKELEQRRGRHCDNAIDFSQPPIDDDKDSLWPYIIGGFVLFGLIAIQAILKSESDIKKVIEPFGLFFIILWGVIGSLIGLGVGLFRNRIKRKPIKLSTPKCVILGILLLGLLALLGLIGEEEVSKIEMAKRFLWGVTFGGFGGWVWGKLSNWKPKKVSEDDRKLWDAISAIGMYGEASRYLSFLLNSMSIGESITIRESESLPEYEMEDLERLPCFSEICAYLKPTMEIEDRFYEQPIQGELISCVRDKQSKKKQYNHTVTICDGIEDAYITFQRNDKEKSGTSNC